MVDDKIVQMDSFELLELINSLISLKYEGEWWDFKRQWPDKHSLLHDIVCMANNVSFRTALIIIGVDEEKDFNFCTTKDDAKSKNTQMIVDLLKDKPFLGGKRPEVEVKRLDVDKFTCIDVVIIRSTRYVPYIFSKDCKNLKAGNVYTRVNDSNTSTNATADLDKTEKLWQHRFYMDTTPVDKMNLYITDYKNWHDGYSDKDNGSWFYTRHPEYTLGIIDDDRKGAEYYHNKQCDKTPYWGSLYLRYHQTVIDKFDITYLDGGRYFNVAPNIAFIKDCFCNRLPTLKCSYCYFIKNTNEYRLFELFNYMQQKSCDVGSARDRFKQSIIIYESFNEKEMIDTKINSDIEGFRKLVEANTFSIYIDERFNDDQKESFLKSFAVVDTINNLLSEYRLENF